MFNIQKLTNSTYHLPGIFLVKSGSKGDRLLFRYPYELTENQASRPTDDRYELNKLTSYDSCDSSSRRLTSSVSSIMSSNSNLNLNSCQSAQIEKKKNPYALIEDNNGSLFNYNLGFNASSANTVKTPTATLSSDLNPFYKFNSATQLGNKNPNNLQPKFSPLNPNKIDSCLLNVINLPDKILSDLLAVKSDLCGNKFELKINDVRFVGHPVLLSSKNNFQSSNGIRKHGTNSHLNKGNLMICLLEIFIFTINAPKCINTNSTLLIAF